MSIYTDGTYFKNNPTWDLEHSAFKARFILKILTKNSIEPKSIIDFGCGVGGVLFELNKSYPDASLIGYEVSPQAINEGKKMFGETIKFRTKPPEVNTDIYQLAMALDVIEHVEDYFTLIKNMKEVSEYVILHIPLEINLRWILNPKLYNGANEKNGHIHFFNKETAICALKWAGLEVIDALLTPHAIELANNPKAKLAAMPRKMLSGINVELATRVFGGWSLLVLAK